MGAFCSGPGPARCSRTNARTHTHMHAHTHARAHTHTHTSPSATYPPCRDNLLQLDLDQANKSGNSSDLCLYMGLVHPQNLEQLLESLQLPLRYTAPQVRASVSTSTPQQCADASALCTGTPPLRCVRQSHPVRHSSVQMPVHCVLLLQDTQGFAGSITVGAVLVSWPVRPQPLRAFSACCCTAF